MFLIKSFFKKPCPQINVSYTTSYEEVSDTKIEHQFVCFDAKDADIADIFSAGTIAKSICF